MVFPAAVCEPSMVALESVKLIVSVPSFPVSHTAISVAGLATGVSNTDKSTSVVEVQPDAPRLLNLMNTRCGVVVFKKADGFAIAAFPAVASAALL